VRQGRSRQYKIVVTPQFVSAKPPLKKKSSHASKRNNSASDHPGNFHTGRPAKKSETKSAVISIVQCPRNPTSQKNESRAKNCRAQSDECFFQGVPPSEPAATSSKHP
jgi:hypothetical protein